MNEIDKRSLWLFDYAMNIAKLNKKDLCEAIGLKQPGYFAITEGRRGFTHEQLKSLLKLTNASADWVYGFSTEVFRPQKRKTKVQLFNEAMATLREMIE